MLDPRDSLQGMKREGKRHERSSPGHSRGGARSVRDDSRKLRGPGGRGARRGPGHDGGTRARHRALRETDPERSLLREPLAGTVRRAARCGLGRHRPRCTAGRRGLDRLLARTGRNRRITMVDAARKRVSGITWPTIGSFRAMATTGSRWPKGGAASGRQNRFATPAMCSMAGPSWSSSRRNPSPPLLGATRLPLRFASGGLRMSENAWPTMPTARPTRRTPAGGPRQRSHQRPGLAMRVPHERSRRAPQAAAPGTNLGFGRPRNPVLK
jgi:hypothetical protein